MPLQEYFEKKYRILSKQFDDALSHYIPLPIPLTEQEKAVQTKLKDIAEKCITLTYETMRRLPHAERLRLDDVLLPVPFRYPFLPLYNLYLYH